MTVTELVILTLDDAYLHESSGVVSKIQAIRDRMRSIYQNETLDFHRQIENPQTLYVLAEWPSIEAHTKASAAEDAQLVIMELLAIAKPLTVMHVELPLSAFPLGAPVISIGRYFVTKEKKEEFYNLFTTVKPLLEEYVVPFTLAYGWRVDLSDEQKNKGEEELLMVAGWPTVEKHQGFSKTDMWEKYSKIQETIVGAEVVHATKLTS